MSILDTLIISSCIGFSGSQQEACSKALVVAAKQSGIETNINNAENRMSQKLDKSIRAIIGNNVDVVVTTAIVAKMAVDKSATIKLPTFGMCSSAMAILGQQQSSLNFEWKY